MSGEFGIVKITFWGLLLALVVWSTPLRAQYNTASLGGTVLDSSGASVPRVTVTVQNKETGLTKTTTTGTDGVFLFPSLPVGKYRLTVELTGFTTYIQEGITLAVGQAANQTVALNVGKAAEQVTVTANAELVATRDATLGQVVDERRVVDLPLNGRGAQALVFLAAGTANVTDRYCGLNCEGGVYPGQQQAAVSGSGPGNVNYQLDGAGHNDTYINANLPFPNPDAIQEFSLQSDNLSAVYGDAAGVVNIVSKSGTNDLHGDVFEFLRNGKLNARNFFASDQDTLKRNQFGGSVGGPIKKDKVFYFATYQGTRVRSAPGGQIAFVPTSAERGGDFSARLTGVTASPCASAGKPAAPGDPTFDTGAIFDPTSARPFTCGNGNTITLENQFISGGRPNLIPPGRLSPVANFFLQSIPLPNGPGRQLTYVGGSTMQNDDQFTTKIDYNGGRHQVSGRYFYTYFKQPPVISKSNVLLDVNTGNHVRVQTVSVNDSFAVSSSLLFNTWFGYHAQTGGSLTSAPFGFPDAGVKIAAPTPPELRVAVGGGFAINTNHNGDFDRKGWTFRENVTLVRGAHEVRVGGEAVHIRVEVRNDYHQSGVFNFANALTGDNMADFLIGQASGSPGFIQGGGEFMLLSGIKWSAFAQDNWRLNPRLTFNLGLRWEPYFPYTELKGRIVCFQPGAQSGRYPNAPVGMIFGGGNHDSGCPQNGSNVNAGNFAPRLGFAYRLTQDGRTSLRGGGGFYYAPPATAGYTNFVDNAPFSPQFGFITADFTDPFGSNAVPNPFPAQYAPSIPGPATNFTLPVTILLAFQPDYKLPFLGTWNLTLERQVGQDWLLRAAYAGNKGGHLYGSDFKGYTQLNPTTYIPNGPQNRLFGNFGSVSQLGAFNNSNYNALQLTAEKRFGHGFLLLANYTWSKTLDDFSPQGSAVSGFGATDPFNRRFDYGRSDDDIAQQFKFSDIWQIPRLNVSGLAGKLVNGWELNSIWAWQGGFPFSIFSGSDNSHSAQGMDRADFVKPGNPQLSSGRSHGAMVSQFFDTSFFGPNAVGTFGNSGKNILRGPKFLNVDVGLLKKTNLTERTSIQFRAEFFNIFNNVNLGIPQGGPLAIDNFQPDPTFGQILAAGDPRVIQFALKFLF